MIRTGLQVALLLLNFAKYLIAKFEREKTLNEGEQRAVVKALVELAAAAKMARQIEDEVGKMTDAEIDDALRGDLRP
jgi:dsRNA-specific ribonuclease